MNITDLTKGLLINKDKSANYGIRLYIYMNTLERIDWRNIIKINYQMTKDKLGFTLDNYRKWIKILMDLGYINHLKNRNNWKFDWNYFELLR